jgi:16S rRNA (cytidine1402-2'-O)-methyltransferase
MSILYIVPTPIGNLEDITFKAIRVLKEVDLILVEDTRTSIKLLKHYEIQTPYKSFHMYNEHKKLDNIIDQIKSGKILALISDAGTPSISDPGYLLVREAIKNNIRVECLPGATSVIPALVQSGLPSDRFVFEGFLPLKKGRIKRFETLADEIRTIIIFESPHKLLKTLIQLVEYFGEERQIAIARELTKIYEENFRGSLMEALKYFEKNKPRGEFVISVSGKK